MEQKNLNDFIEEKDLQNFEKKPIGKYTLTTVISSPKRGPYGDPNYPGNCSGYPIKLMLLFFKPKSVLDPMEGGGTCRDVCKELGISYDGFDLAQGYDMYSMKFEKKYDFIHWHPPYFKMYSKSYKNIVDDLRNIALIKRWDQYLKKLEEGFEILFSALTEGGVLAILLGLRRIGGRVYDAASHIVSKYQNYFIGEIIKLQHNILHKARFGSGYSKLVGYEGVVVIEEDLSEETFSPCTFHGKPFILITHEKYILFRKTKGG